MGRSSLEWLCSSIAVVRRGSSLATHLHISLAKDIFWHRSTTGSQRSSATANMRTARAPIDSLPQHLPQRLFAGDGHAREIRPGHCLPAPEATVPLPLIDVRVQWSTRHQDNAAQHAPMREFLLRTLSSLSDALVSAQWRPRVLHCRTNGSDAVPRGLRSQQTVTWYEGPEASFDTCSSSLSSRLVGRQQKSAAHPRHPPRSGDDGR